MSLKKALLRRNSTSEEHLAVPKKKYIVTLSDAEREEIEQLLRSGKHSSQKVTRAPAKS